MSETAQKQKIVIYDAKAGQAVLLEISDDDGKYQITQIYDSFDDVLAEYDRLREVNLISEGNEQIVETLSDVADEWFFEQKCVDVQGFEGEKPADWKARIDIDEKREGISRLLRVKVLSPDEPKTVKSRSWNGSVNKNRIALLSSFNGKEVETAITFKPKRPSDISKYNRLKSRISLKEGKGFEQSGFKIPTQMAAKAAIAEEIGFTSENYQGDIVPIHHLATALTAYFDKSIKSAGK